MNWYEKALTPLEGHGKWNFDPLFFFWVFVGAGLLCTLSRYLWGVPSNFSAVMATYGAFGACCGVVTLGRPMIRAGGYRSWYEKERIVGGAPYAPTPESTENERQAIMDAFAVQIVGPALVIVGTMINGLSGFFS